MKKLLLALFVMCSALSFSAKVIKANNAEVRENNIVYEAGQNAPYTGIIETYNEKGVLESEAEYKDGKMNGFSKLYYPNGKLGSEATFKDNVQDGLQKDYFEDGKVKLEIPYKNGKADGVAKAYDETGKVIEQVTFKNGVQVK